MRVHARTQPDPQQQLAPNVGRSGGKPFATSHTVHPILNLQRLIGNQAIQRLGRDEPGCFEAVSDAFPFERFGHDFSRRPIHARTSVRTQPKLAVNTPGDIYEQEADRVSNLVMRTPEPQLRRACACGGRCDTCRKEQTENGHQHIQAKSAAAHAAAGVSAPPIVNEVLRSGGQALAPATANFFVERLGYDFSRVRVHTDSRAAESARAVGALAYTVGRDVVFGAGQFSPQSAEGRRLLAHELTHVVQQTAPMAAALRLQRAPDKEPKKAPAQEPKKETPKEAKRVDVVLLGEGVISGEELASVLAPGGKIIRVKSMSEAVAALSKIDVPIGTLYFITHSLANGALQFGKSEGFVKPDDIAGKVNGAVPANMSPQNVDFRGCSGALGAKSVVGGTCYAVIQNTTPVKITVGGKEVTQASDVTQEDRPEFERLRKSTVNKLGPAARCILNNSDKGYFALGGKYVALWFNTSLSTKWKKDESVCYKAINPEIVDPNQIPAAIKGCRRVRVEEQQPKPVGTKP